MSRSVIRDGDFILKEILELVSEGYSVGFRPYIGDSFQIRLQKDNLNVCRVLSLEDLRYTAAMDAESYIFRALLFLKAEMDYYECCMEANKNGHDVE